MILPVKVVWNTLVAGCSRETNSTTGSNPGSQIYYGSMEYVRTPFNSRLSDTVSGTVMYQGPDSANVKNFLLCSRSWEN